MTEYMVDARGLSCPEPVILVKRSMEALKKGRILALVDTGAARDNVSRMAKNNGWAVTVTDLNGEFRLDIVKE